MAKPPYPGLVIVPPSDRWILRQRLVRLALLITTVMSCTLAITHWLPSSGNKPNCKTAIDDREFPDSREECAQPDLFVTEMQPGQSESLDVEASRAVDQADSASRVVTVADSDPHPDVRLAQQGDAFAQYRLGRFLAQRGEPHAQESVNWYRRAADGLRRLAEAGNGQAMYVLGVMNAFGRGVAKDREQARRWLTQAVNYQVAAARPVLARLEKYREPEPKADEPRDTKPTDARQTDARPTDARPTDARQMDARQTYVKPRDAEPSLQANVQVQRVRHEN